MEAIDPWAPRGLLDRHNFHAPRGPWCVPKMGRMGPIGRIDAIGPHEVLSLEVACPCRGSLKGVEQGEAS